MARIQKWVLWLLTGLIPVVIAACYGMPYDYRGALSIKPGRVQDKKSGQGIQGIQLLCLTESGDIQSHAFSDEQGQFVIGVNELCSVLAAEDVDGEDNGGPYLRREVTLEPGDEDQVIELSPPPALPAATRARD